ncbi:methylmalonyl-CoA mutase family protein [Immundisolibacter sp.]|uniref:methylmalonyl-CoA mutase family protein n=1 Tax=Immundisolibacter sp. TaxID=1934948 RepID=UPI003564AE5E
MQTARSPDAGAVVAGNRPLRFITAASLFDGHDAAINIMRRLMQEQGAEVVHLGHNRGVQDIVRAALQEDADGIAISSYQGGHVEFFKYMVDLLREAGASHVRVFGGGGGVIVPAEIQELETYGVERLYSPEDGRTLGLDGMIADMLARTAAHRVDTLPTRPADTADHLAIARCLTTIETRQGDDPARQRLAAVWPKAVAARPPIIGITGPGGAGKSSLTDELLLRFVREFEHLRVAVLAVDPTRRRTGGALLGDRIRLNALADERIFMRSVATRRSHLATSAVLKDEIDFLADCGFGLIVVETAGIGQSDSEVVDLVDLPIYVMTSEYGAATQLEKIDMLDYAELVVLNKFEKRGAEDALRDVRKQWRRNRHAFDLPDADLPVFPTIASQFNDPGVNWLFVSLCRRLVDKLGLDAARWTPALDVSQREPRAQALIPPSRARYLAEITASGRGVRARLEREAEAASLAQSHYQSLAALEDPALPAALTPYPAAALTDSDDRTLRTLRQRYNAALAELDDASLALLRDWPARHDAVTSEHYAYDVRGRTVSGDNYVETLSDLRIPKLAPPPYRDWGELLRFLGNENLPGAYPYTGGVYPYRRAGEDPIRMFAGEGTPERTNRRFHYLSKGQPAARLSTAFDSVTLYGEDPHPRPDIYGKVGNSGVSICCLDDMKKLYSGFDLCDPSTSVSMTINGPAPMILAMFLNAAIDQQVEKHLHQSGQWAAAEQKIHALLADAPRPAYAGELPSGNDGLGLGLLGVTGDQVVDADTYARIAAETLKSVRGTVQADILKEDQAQNTCIFSTEFALRMMGDIQQYFVDRQVRNFYSVSISGYHIAEAGANPISQLAFTLANGFTIVEYYLARGMRVDDFAPNLSFFFSNGMDPEYAVLGRVARRIWARAMRERYGAGPRSQMMKYHIQTSGRSLHAQEIQFNDVRTTLQALYALYDNCNSLHTNAYDEAITTPTEESVRRAVAIQLIINKELGLNKNENSLQGSFIVEQLTDLVEEAVYQEFERLSERGGVLGAMETQYQRGKIQEESLHYEHKKHDGSLPIVGVNTFLTNDTTGNAPFAGELIRSTDAEKALQLEAVDGFKARHSTHAAGALLQLQRAATAGENSFAALMEAARHATLGQMSHALYAVGGQYRRSM